MKPTQPFSISRILKAPRALVFRVYSEVSHLENWLSPAGFHSIHTVMDFKVGGTYHYGLEGPNGMQMWGMQVFREIVPNENIVLVQSFSDKDGGLTRHPMSATWPLQMLATTTFEDAGSGQTKVTVSWLPMSTDEFELTTFDQARAGMVHGFEGTFVKLEAYLATL